MQSCGTDSSTCFRSFGIRAAFDRAHLPVNKPSITETSPSPRRLRLVLRLLCVIAPLGLALPTSTVVEAKGRRAYWWGTVGTEGRMLGEPFKVYDVDDDGTDRPVPLPTGYAWTCVIRTTMSGPSSHARLKENCSRKPTEDGRKGCLAIANYVDPNTYEKEIRCSAGAAVAALSVSCSEKFRKESQSLTLLGGSGSDPITIMLGCTMSGPLPASMIVK